MLPSSTAVTLSQAPPAPVQWYDHVLRKKYRDPLKLKQALTAMYGEGNYRIKGGSVDCDYSQRTEQY
ncbi:uncharacterized protein NCU05354 [Neurospora crassa OR74A]|uniref:Uncharacterized protein n=1 Tax=Neurospora crassa (strain ATCC 24698 / 74-OR23-1A / CBS 708.71 / DSM 1257 / FGSC 987) TaxID=367110 RepID=V5INB4_NEUCR|nr:uncharacterized protein NCU05354 [Neurospora crassa OR74A]ESA43537.1 hypothetical protein, variant [Neurospora crassa OR74A]|eukprot:XP_011393565.1 uncharacterized protein NCU05354 [Neurospora crassa OR74A]